MSVAVVEVCGAVAQPGNCPVLVPGDVPGHPDSSERGDGDAGEDLDGSAAEGTVRFGLDGTEYEIDLNARHAQELRDALARYVGSARRVGGIARR